MYINPLEKVEAVSKSKVEAVEAYPLQWPVGVQRTSPSRRTKPQFLEQSWHKSLGELQRQVRLLGGRQMVLSTNQPLRNDGMPYAAVRRIDDPGAALWFVLDGEPMCFPCDRWVTLGLNMRAIAMNLDAMRAMQRWSVGTVKQQFTGYKALTAGSPVEAWWDVLECTSNATIEIIQAQYKARLRSAHPETGGSNAAISRLNAARDQAVAFTRGSS